MGMYLILGKLQPSAIPEFLEPLNDETAPHKTIGHLILSGNRYIYKVQAQWGAESLLPDF